MGRVYFLGKLYITYIVTMKSKWSLIIAITVLQSYVACNKDEPAELFDEKLSQPFTDNRDGKQYKTVKTGKLVWMAENLDYDAGDSLSWCNKGDCKKYGRVYHWSKANSVCPSGWHLPSVQEWIALDNAIAIAASPDSYCDYKGELEINLLENGWWTSSKSEKDSLYLYNSKIRYALSPDNIGDNYDHLACTVRCIQDTPRELFLLTEKIKQNPTDWCRSIEQDETAITGFSYAYSSLCVNPAEITAYWLNATAKKYEMRFGKPVPQCRQCTDLELLLMLEDAIEENSPELEIPLKEEDAKLKAQLQKAKAQYENKFKIRAPWWYMCSDKEHLKRLQKAIKSNKPDLDYSYGFEIMHYRVGKRLAAYERRFKKPAPNWDESECSSNQRWKRLVKALEENTPLFTEKEEAEMRKNRHSFHFKHKGDVTQSISVSKTLTGAIVEYQLPTTAIESADTLSVNISAEEWQNFTSALQETGIMDWEKSYMPAQRKEWRDEKEWQVEIFLPDVPDSARFQSFGYESYPPGWDNFIKLMESIKKRTSQKLENKLKAEYKARFEKNITEQELSMEAMSFTLNLENKTPMHSYSEITITRTASGATVHYRAGPAEGVRLSMEDWLDFINALYESSFTDWNKSLWSVSPLGQLYDQYFLNIYNSNNIKGVQFMGSNQYPPNWGKFIKAINDIRAKAKKNSATMEMEDRMKTEYQKRFRKKISEFELSLKSIFYDGFSRQLNNSLDVHLNRTDTGAIVEYKVGYGDDATVLKETLSMGDWLDFLNDLKQCPEKIIKGNKLQRQDICCRNNARDCKPLKMNYNYWSVEAKSTGNADEMKFYAEEICAPKWDEFMKVLESNGALPIF